MVLVRRFLALLLACSLVAPTAVRVRAVAPPVHPDDAQGQAPGRPYSGDCATAIPAAERLKQGLAVHEETMRRAQAVIAAAARGAAPGGPPVPPSVDIAKSVLSKLLEEKNALRERIENLKLSDSASQSRARVLKSFDRISLLSTAVDGALAAGKYKLAMDEVTNLREAIEATGTALMDSGIADMLAAEAGARLLGGSLGGPVGILAVQVAALGIDVGAAEIDSQIQANDVRQAQDTYDAIKYQYDAVQERIRFLVDNCGPAPETRQEKKPEKGSRKPPAEKQAPQDGGKSSNAGKVIGLVAGAAGGGLIAAYVANKYANSDGGSGCDPSKAPINEINYYCFGSTRNTSMCNQYIAKYDSFCKSCGYSRFDVNSGGCR